MTRRNRNATQVSNISAGLLEELDHEIETGERFESEAFEMNSLAEMQADANLTADLEQAAIDSMDSVDLEDTDETPSEYPIYASGDRFTADNLFSGSKRHYYLTVENALTARFMGVRFQQVYQAVSYGKMATGDQADA
jgi:hypothetical protein